MKKLRDHAQLVLLPLLLCWVGCTTRSLPLKDLGYNFRYEEKTGHGGPLEVYTDTAGKKLRGAVQIAYGGTTEKGSMRAGRWVDSQWVYREGLLAERNFYKRGYQEGLQQSFREASRTQSVYRKGKKEGWEKEWKGEKLIRKVRYRQGIKSGKESYFNSLGKESALIHYQLTRAEKVPPLDWRTHSIALESDDRSDHCPPGDTALPGLVLGGYRYAGTLEITGYDHPGVGLHDHGYRKGDYDGVVEDALDGLSCLDPSGKCLPTYYLVEISLGSFDQISPREQWIVFSGEVCLTGQNMIGKLLRKEGVEEWRSEGLKD